MAEIKFEIKMIEGTLCRLEKFAERMEVAAERMEAAARRAAHGEGRIPGFCQRCGQLGWAGHDCRGGVAGPLLESEDDA